MYYEGTENWTVPRDFKSRLQQGESFGKYVPDFEYYLVQEAWRETAEQRRRAEEAEQKAEEATKKLEDSICLFCRELSGAWYFAEAFEVNGKNKEELMREFRATQERSLQENIQEAQRQGLEIISD